MTDDDLTFWNSTDCAEFFRCTRRHFMEQIKPHYTFPAALYLPRVDGAASRPLWRASEVRAWAENHGRAARREVRRPERNLKRAAQTSSAARTNWRQARRVPGR